MRTTTDDQVRVDDALRRAISTIRELKAQVAELRGQRSRTDEPVAIISTAVRLPGGANTPADLWDLLCSQRPTVGLVPASRWDAAAGQAPEVGGGHFAGTIDNVADFDADFFGLSPAEATAIDPQQRLILEVCWEAAERAGWPVADLAGSRAGVFLGVGHQDYLMSWMAADQPITGHLGAGNARSIIANRVSYLLGLRGPSVAVDTACSSSLVAVHLACQSLRTGESDLAFAGGVNLILSPLSTTVTGRALPLAPDGRCKAFDAGADGMVRGEGVAVVALKRLSDAQAGGDPVLAVIRASGCNQDGRTNGLTAPNPVAQSDLLAEVLLRSGLSATDVTYIETHGTGTPLGDPIEFEAIQDIYGQVAAGGDAGQTPTCWLGSVKPNIGHLEAAAGIASLVKAVLAVKHGQIPGQVNLTTVNPGVPLTGTRFRLPLKTEDWTPDGLRRAAVSSFGFGGTNAHIIVEQPVAGPQAFSGPAGEEVVVLPVSGHTPAALCAQLDSYAVALADGADAAAVAAAAARRRTHQAYRRAVVAAAADLPPATSSAAVRAAAAPSSPAASAGRLAFIYSGQATRWSGIQLDDPVVADELAAWDDAGRRLGFPSLIDTVAAGQLARALTDTRFAQFAIAAVQAALTQKWAAWGVKPDAACGHSMGEISAAVAAGILSRQQALRLIHARADAMHDVASGGAMAVLALSAAQVEDRLAAHGDPNLALAIHNGPRSCVVSGPSEAVTRFARTVTDVKVTFLETQYAFHSPVLADVAGAVRRVADSITPHPATCDLYSTVAGGGIVATDMSGDHWVRNMTAMVRFHDAVQALAAAGYTRFVEIGPHPALLTHVEAALADAGVSGVVTATARRDRRLQDTFAGAAAQLWEAGQPIAWESVYPEQLPLPEGLPTTSWERRRHWFAVNEPMAPGHQPLTTSNRADPAVPSTDEMLHWVRRLVADAAEFESVDEVDATRPANELDVDSAAFVEVKNQIEDRLGVPVPITVLLDGATLTQIAEDLARRAGRPATPASADRPSRGVDVDQLSEEEVDRLLAMHRSDPTAMERQS